MLICACTSRVELGSEEFVAEGRGLHTHRHCFDASIIPAFRANEEKLRIAAEVLMAIGMPALAKDISP